MSLICSPALLACVSVLAATWWLYKRRRDAKYNLPPAPWVRIPVLGNLLQLMRCPKNMCEHFYDLSKNEKYSKVFTMYMGCHRAIVLNHVDVIQEVLTQRQNDYASRPTMYSIEKMTKGGADISMGRYGPVWKHQRKVGQMALKNYASGECLERMVDEALNITLASIRKQAASGEAFNIKPHLVLLVMNTLSGVCFGKTYQLEDPVMDDFVDVTREALDILENGLPADFIPVLQYLPTSSKEKQMDAILEKYFSFLDNHFKDHLEKHESGGSDQLNDLTDYLLWHHDQEEKQETDKKGLLTNKHLRMILFDVLGAGIDTMVTNLHYFIGHMMMNPDVEAGMLKEIENVIGGGPVQLSHRAKMPYTEACFKENLRKGTLVVLGVPLATTCDTKIDKYDVPKDTLAIINFWALHNDPEQWDKPNEFRPERFLDSEGNLGPKPAAYFPFSGGRRVCLGEGLAKSTLMMVIPKLFQTLKFSSPLGKDFHLEFEEASSFIKMPKPYDVIVEER